MQDKLVSTLRANYLLWPIVNLFAFRFVPGDLRILFCNVIGVSAQSLCLSYAYASFPPWCYALSMTTAP